MGVKFLQLNVTANWGSTGKIAESIGYLAQIKCWHSYLIYSREPNLSKLKTIKVGNFFDQCYHYIQCKYFDNEGLASDLSTKRLIKKIKKIQPDIIQIHNIHDHWLNYKLLFEYLNTTDIKIVWTFHDCWAFTGHCYHFIEHKCIKWKTICDDCIIKNKYVDNSKNNFLLKKSLFSASKNLVIVSCSEWMSNLVKESFLKDKKIQIIHNGIDLNLFKILPNYKKNDGKFHIIAVANIWLPYKGLNDIIKLRTLLSSEYEMTIVGVSVKQLKVLPLGIHGVLRTQNVHDLVKLYNESDVLINPTYADTFPTVNLEALACGIPVVTYCTGGSPEAVDRETGVVVEQGNVNALVTAIQQLKEKPLSSEACRKRAEKYFDRDKCYEEYIRLYERLL